MVSARRGPAASPGPAHRPPRPPGVRRSRTVRVDPAGRRSGPAAGGDPGCQTPGHEPMGPANAAAGWGPGQREGLQQGAWSPPKVLLEFVLLRPAPFQELLANRHRAPGPFGTPVHDRSRTQFSSYDPRRPTVVGCCLAGLDLIRPGVVVLLAICWGLGRACWRFREPGQGTPRFSNRCENASSPPSPTWGPASFKACARPSPPAPNLVQRAWLENSSARLNKTNSRPFPHAIALAGHLRRSSAHRPAPAFRAFPAYRLQRPASARSTKRRLTGGHWVRVKVLRPNLAYLLPPGSGVDPAAPRCSARPSCP